MSKRLTCICLVLSMCVSTVLAQTGNKGSLFIIGGGHRSDELMKEMIQVAGLTAADYIAVLPMSSEEPDSGYVYFKESMQPLCKNSIINLNFTSLNVNNKGWLDSLKKAKLIFITGGDQARFMKIVLHTPVYDAIHEAYKNGATVAGTSAGAAVMSREMITGNELTDTVYHETFRQLRTNNIEFKEGLGLLDSAIIDQHFIARSRYNRLLSALNLYPRYNCIGIDEATAIIVHDKKITVAGDGQVVSISEPIGIAANAQGLIKFKDIRFSIYTAGDNFPIK